MLTETIAILLTVQSYTLSTDEYCNILCSNFYDQVCGMIVHKRTRPMITTFHNICHLRKIKCRLKNFIEIYRIPDRICNIKKYVYDGRRVNDFSIVGAHQVCNHTCPTYCIDTYEPACAQIWQPNMQSYKYRPMINHCHIDMFSCAVGVNVTIHPLSKCYKNPAGLMFMSQVAAMKSLKLFDEENDSNLKVQRRQRKFDFKANN